MLDEASIHMNSEEPEETGMTTGEFVYDYPRPMVTADAVVFAVRNERLEVLLIERKHEPFAGTWALPGGFVEMGESLEAAAARELDEETGVCGVKLEQIHTFGDPGRDPRGRSITVAYMGMVDWRAHTLKAADDAAKADWFPIDDLPHLAFDHSVIIDYAVRRMRSDA